MPIVSSDLKFKLSGGASNTDGNASLGGAESSTDAGNIFDNVSSAEAAAGDVEYRCEYLKNEHATLTALDAKVFIQAQTPSGDTSVEIGLGTAAIGTGNEQTVANESTAPSGVTFSAPTSGAPLSIGDIPPGQHKAIWIKRTVNAAAAVASDGFTLRATCDTLP